MKKLVWIAICSLLVSQNLKAQQDEESDSLDLVQLEDVVVTGQYSAQSLDKSIYQVEVISQEDIKNFAGNTVADVLNQNLNILIVPNRSSGDSQVEIMGLGGQYTKILIDNIPVVGDNGLGVNIDLTKINLDNIERIEIVKGAMGVDYGNNALTGVINIITKKSLKTKWKINAFVQEETVNDEYDWYEDGGVSKGKGRHIQGLEISRNITDNWFASVGVNRNDFQGYWGNKKGRKDVSKLRGYEWQPKEQWNANAMINYRSKNFKAFYKANYLNEVIDSYKDSVNLISLGEGQQTYISDDDRNYNTTRWIHHLNIDTRLFNRVKFIGDFSYQTQERKLRSYTYDIAQREILSMGTYSKYASSDAFYSRGMFSNFLDRQNFDFQVGYELDNTKGFRAAIPGLFSENIEKTLGTYAAFASAEFRMNSGLSLRPGIRANFSNKFDEKFNFSLSGKYNLTTNTSIRANVGTTNRYPNFEELYTYFVDINHSVKGNESLVAENGYSTSIQWNHKLNNKGLRMHNNISTIYLNLDDKIELATVNFTPLEYQYINIDKYRAWGINTDHNFTFNNFNIGLGASLMGISRSMGSDLNVEPEDNFLYAFEANASVNYTIPKWATTFSAYYKYTGKQSEYVLEDVLGEPYFRLGEQEPFSLLDASLRKSFFDNSLEITLGTRNIFDVTSIRNTSLSSENAHSEASNQLRLFYGRSYFLKLSYTLNFN